MSLKKRGSTYHYDFVYNGKRYRGTTKETDKQKALEFEARLKATIMKGKTEKGILKVAKRELRLANDSDGFPIDAQEMLNFYCKNSPQSKKAQTTITKIFKMFQDFCETNEVTNFADIDRRIAFDYISFVKKRESSTHTRKKNLAYITAFGNQLHRCGFIESNPFANLPKEKHTATSYDAYTLEELKLIESKATGVLYIIYCVAINTGLRKIDIINLKKEDVNLEENFIKVKTQKTGSVVVLPMLPKLRKLVEEYITSEGEYLFPELHSLNDSLVSTMFSNFLEEIGIPHTKNGRCVKGIHSFRHTFVYLAAKGGIPINIVQAIVGHATQTMTMHYSQHASLEDTKKSLTKLPSFLTMGVESNRELLQQKISSLDISNEIKQELLTLLAQV